MEQMIDIKDRQKRKKLSLVCRKGSEKELPYSYHTFLFPFMWKRADGKKSDQSLESILRSDGELEWVRDKREHGRISDPDFYGQVQYFKRDVSSILLDTYDTHAVKTYTLTYKGKGHFSRDRYKNLPMSEDRKGQNYVKKLKKLMSAVEELKSDTYKIEANNSDAAEKMRMATQKISEAVQKLLKETEEKKQLQSETEEKFDEKTIRKKTERKYRNCDAIGHYIISKQRYKGADAEEFWLDINAIHLSVYDVGVAVLSLELEYWGDKVVNGTLVNSCTIDDVNAINEYGRRINLPYVGSDEYHAIVADKIEIRIGDFSTIENYKKTLKEYIEAQKYVDLKKQLNSHFIMKPIKEILLGENAHIDDTIDIEKLDQHIVIEPIIDDRMYVCCLLVDYELSESLKQKDENGEYEAFNNPEIYKLSFIENSLSCQSVSMMHDILKRCIYDRWIEYGTIDIVTHHSFVRITSGKAVHVVTSFLSQYVKMAELAVLQRATLISLENDCAISEPYEIEAIQDRYVKAQQEILLDECTVQEQGIEEFALLRQELFIDQRTQSLDKRLKDLYELANLRHDRDLNKKLTWLSLVGLLLALIPIIQTFVESSAWATLKKFILSYLGGIF